MTESGSNVLPLAPRPSAGASNGDALAEVASSVVESVLSPRRGRKPGSPRIPGSGRKPGTLNRRTIAVQEAMRPIMPKARKALVRLLTDKGVDDEVVLKAAALAHAYYYGKPVETREISGPDGAPLVPNMRIEDATLAALRAFGTEVATGAGETMAPDELAAVLRNGLADPAAELQRRRAHLERAAKEAAREQGLATP